MAQTKTLSTIVHASPEIRELVGQAPHVTQVTAYANVTSKAQFARLLVAVGLGGRDEAAVLRDLKNHCSTPRHRDDLTDGIVYVRPVIAGPDTPFVPLTPTTPKG